MVWQIPEELRMEVAGLGSVRPYASMRYMSKGAYSPLAQYRMQMETDPDESRPDY